MTQRIDRLVARRATMVCGPINLHAFGGLDSPVDEKSGDGTGIGTLVLRAKYHLYKGQVADIAGALLLKLPTGDEDNFLGTGTMTLRPFLIVSRTFFDVITPHLNLGYKLDFDWGHQDALHYILGFETGIEKCSVVVDVLGKHKPKGNGIADHMLTGSFAVSLGVSGVYGPQHAPRERRHGHRPAHPTTLFPRRFREQTSGS